MRTLSEFNKEYLEARTQWEKDRWNSGVACDNCGIEMLYVSPNLVLGTDPPMQAVVCPNCNYRNYKYR